MLPRTCPFPLVALALLLACGDDPPLGGTSASGTTGGGTTGEPGTTGTPTTGTATTSIMTTDVTTTSSGAPDTTGDPGTGSTGDPDAPIVVDGLSHPESVLWDKTADVYLISNVNGDPLAADDNGFITRVEPDGTVVALEWISGAGDVELNAPKGMAVVADTLYVADITVVRKFDRNTGAPLGAVPVDGAVLLNDLAAAPGGDVYVSDTLTDSIHIIDPADQVTLLLSDPGLKGPNGLFAVNDGVYAASYSDVRLFFVDRNAPQPLTVYMLPKGQLDGIARTPSGDWLVTSWAEPGVFTIDSQLNTDSLALPGIPSPADLDYDNKRDRALLPLFEQNRAEFHKYP